jgi:urease accessory protein
MSMNAESLVGLLQFSDGLFPAGAYAHSCGLETYVQSGAIADASLAQEFLRAHLEGAAGRIDAVAVVNALRAAESRKISQCLELDAILEAMKPAAEMRAASRQMGRQTLRVAAQVLDDSVIGEFAEIVHLSATPCHHAVVFGIAGAAQRWRPRDAAIAYLYATSAAIAGAAVRLIPLGQMQGQSMIHSLAPLIVFLAENALKMSIDDMAGFAPALEIAAMRHERLEARLFRS